MADMGSTNNTSSASEDQSQEQELSLVGHKSLYKVQTFAIKSPELEEPITLVPECINNILIIQDFDECLQPVFQVTAVLPPLIIDYILMNKTKISINMRLQQIDLLDPSEHLVVDKNWKSNGTSDITNDDYILFSADGGRVPNLSDYQELSETISGESENDMLTKIKTAGSNFANYKKETILYLWKESDLYNLRAVVNAVYNNATIADAAASLLTDHGFQRVLMAPPDNGGSIRQLIIPPMYMMNVFEFLQTQYGMYSTDVNFFSDIYRCYVIDRSGECKAYEDGEFTASLDFKTLLDRNKNGTCNNYEKESVISIGVDEEGTGNYSSEIKDWCKDDVTLAVLGENKTVFKKDGAKYEWRSNYGGITT